MASSGGPSTTQRSYSTRRMRSQNHFRFYHGTIYAGRKTQHGDQVRERVIYRDLFFLKQPQTYFGEVINKIDRLDDPGRGHELEVGGTGLGGLCHGGRGRTGCLMAMNFALLRGEQNGSTITINSCDDCHKGRCRWSGVAGSSYFGHEHAHIRVQSRRAPLPEHMLISQSSTTDFFLSLLIMYYSWQTI